MTENNPLSLEERLKVLRYEISQQVLRVPAAIEEFGVNSYDEGFQQGILTAMCDEQRFLINYLDGHEK